MNYSFWEELDSEIEKLSSSSGITVNEVRELLLSLLQEEVDKFQKNIK